MVLPCVPPLKTPVWTHGATFFSELSLLFWGYMASWVESEIFQIWPNDSLSRVKSWLTQLVGSFDWELKLQLKLKTHLKTPTHDTQFATDTYGPVVSQKLSLLEFSLHAEIWLPTQFALQRGFFKLGCKLDWNSSLRPALDLFHENSSSGSSTWIGFHIWHLIHILVPAFELRLNLSLKIGTWTWLEDSILYKNSNLQLDLIIWKLELTWLNLSWVCTLNVTARPSPRRGSSGGGCHELEWGWWNDCGLV